MSFDPPSSVLSAFVTPAAQRETTSNIHSKGLKLEQGESSTSRSTIPHQRRSASPAAVMINVQHVSSLLEEATIGGSDVLGLLISYGGHNQETRDVPADNIPPHPTGVTETIVVEDGVNQAGSIDDPPLSGGTAPLRGRVMGVFDHRDGTREVHVSTRVASDEPSIASYEEFTALYHRMTIDRGVASEEKLRSAFHCYVSSCASSMDQPRITAPGVWLSAPSREMARWRREVKLEEPVERPVTFRDLLVYIAGFALSNQLVRLDHQFKGHLFEPGHPSTTSNAARSRRSTTCTRR